MLMIHEDHMLYQETEKRFRVWH